MSNTQTPLICPECKAGKHGNCDGATLDLEKGRVEACRCAIDWHGKPVVATTAVALPTADVPAPPPASEGGPFTYVVLVHRDGARCIWLDDHWFVPLDAGGEGYDCPQDHPCSHGGSDEDAS